MNNSDENAIKSIARAKLQAEAGTKSIMFKSSRINSIKKKLTVSHIQFYLTCNYDKRLQRKLLPAI